MGTSETSRDVWVEVCFQRLIMGDRIIELLYRNLQEVFGEGDVVRRRTAIQAFYKTVCCTYRPASLLGTTLWTSSLETSARRIHTSSIRPMDSHKPCIMGNSGVGLGPERRGPRLHRSGCRHCSRWQDCCALCLSQSQICIAGAAPSRVSLLSLGC